MSKLALVIIVLDRERTDRRNRCHNAVIIDGKEQTIG